MAQPTRTVTIYRNKNGAVEKEQVADVPGMGLVGPGYEYHERILRTYHELECEGKLHDMSPKSKQFVRDVHTYAQDKSYWDSKKYLVPMPTRVQ